MQSRDLGERKPAEVFQIDDLGEARIAGREVIERLGQANQAFAVGRRVLHVGRDLGYVKPTAALERFLLTGEIDEQTAHGASVSPTTLVHETYLSVAGREGLSFPDRPRFLGYIARAMRGLLVDFARQQKALKRGGGFHITQLPTHVGDVSTDSESLIRLSEALDDLAARDARLAEVVDLKYFCGFSFAEIATLHGITERTVQRDWEKARLLLYKQLDASES